VTGGTKAALSLLSVVWWWIKEGRDQWVTSMTGVVARSFLQCFNTVGWVTRNASDLPSVSVTGGEKANGPTS